MFVYQVRSGESAEFFARKDVAQREVRKMRNNGLEAQLYKVDIPTSRDGMVEALNAALGHPSHMIGEKVKT